MVKQIDGLRTFISAPDISNSKIKIQFLMLCSISCLVHNLPAAMSATSALAVILDYFSDISVSQDSLHETCRRNTVSGRDLPCISEAF
jgi:Na+-transporting NADH:ubiquinone oxidoreductase subunit NqrD